MCQFSTFFTVTHRTFYNKVITANFTIPKTLDRSIRKVKLLQKQSVSLLTVRLFCQQPDLKLEHVSDTSPQRYFQVRVAVKFWDTDITNSTAFINSG